MNRDNQRHHDLHHSLLDPKDMHLGRIMISSRSASCLYRDCSGTTSGHPSESSYLFQDSCSCGHWSNRILYPVPISNPSSLYLTGTDIRTATHPWSTYLFQTSFHLVLDTYPLRLQRHHPSASGGAI